MSVVIKVENLSKYYRLGVIGGGTLREDLNRWWAKARGRPDPLLQIGMEDHGNREGGELWALRDVSFEVREGEILGIIGRNGAGKSTLLKILSRITAPTTGQVKIRGRVGSLLEVGTGFHPELTGRENIYLNGAILGMKKAEIDRKLEEIIDFAEIEKFIDTPVKRYSSGMYVRLAFAVAAHLEPEILIVDEVLAVGDSLFQKKCIDKMLEVSRKGKTVLFVSHNLSAVKALCNAASLLVDGRIVFCGDVEKTIERYVGEDRLAGQEIDLHVIDRETAYAQEIIFDKITFLNYPIRFGEKITFDVKLKTTEENRRFHMLDFGVAIRDKNLNTVIHCSNRYLDINFDHLADENSYVFEIDNTLKPGRYSVVLFLRANEIVQDWLSDKIVIDIEDGNPYGYYDSAQIQGVVFPCFSVKMIEARA
ncbi:ABC transporter ATP-binding protein [uncultured Thiodictyon sp.]|uniref:ABC transporter ATP-binding protein n=1 Tax=uncultured Thiodictyon sp. TaxID=1846217 RepID=UPI00260110D2|nr:ABC transporter ATP-binding protein [uncultured Thiodictyon sp.]